MHKDHDGMGHVIYAYYKAKNKDDVLEIVERDDGYIDYGRLGPGLYFRDYKDWLTCEKKAMKFAKGRVLDIGCGAGRVPLHCQGKGLDVVGVDNSPLAVKVCKERGVKKVRLMSVTQITKKLGIFDTIIMFGNNFGLFGNPKRAKWLLKRFYGMTSPEGKIIAESCNPYLTKAKVHLEYHKLNKRRGRMPGQIRLRIRYKKIIGRWFDYLLVSQKEMADILKGTGWHISHTFDENGAFYTAVIEKE